MRLTYQDSYEYLYNRNSLGYRCAEFADIDWSSCTAVFGCSEVFGVSVVEDQTLTHYLSQYTNRPCINLGIPGSSNTTISQCVDFVYSVYAPHSGIVLWTSPYRYPYYSLTYHRYHEMTPVGYSQTEHVEQRESYDRCMADSQWIAAEFRSARSRVAVYGLTEYTVIGESWQAPVLTSMVEDFGADGVHSSGSRCADIARQIAGV